jgi:DNA topoisomerase I
MPKRARTGELPPQSKTRGAKVERLHATGFLRKRAGEGFRYVTAARERPDAIGLERIRQLVVPPAWTDVAIARSPTQALQAVGRDRAGRWQYLYHPAQVRAREERKRRRLVAFIRALPALRTAVRRGLQTPGLSRDKVMCAAIRILSLSFLRPGSAVYAEQNDSYGLATLRPRHVTVRGSRVIFDFPGKSRKRQRHEIVDPRVAAVVRALLKIPGREVFKYRDSDGTVVNIRRRDINAYIGDVMGRRFTAKDFRTWAGTLLCAARLGNRTLSDPVTSRQRRRCIAEELRAVAAALGNTPAVCRASYVSPNVLRAFEKGSLPTRIRPVDLPTLARQETLAAAERSLLKLLER